MGKTKIEWADKVWNPVVGCTKVSQGCKNCYAERIYERFHPGRKFTDIQIYSEKLGEPLHWKKPARVFVNSMSDLFHEKVPFEFILRIFEVMAKANLHTFLILTKRPARMKYFITHWLPGAHNIWLGVSVEDQKSADERIPLLLETPAAKRFVSVEPMLGKVSLNELIPPGKLKPDKCQIDALLGESISAISGCMISDELPSLDWVICGGESGPGARPMHPDWARSLRDQCRAAKVPFFFKQWGEWFPDDQLDPNNRRDPMIETDMTWIRIRKTKAGRLLDGRTWEEFPE